MPEPQAGGLNLKLEGTAVSGTFFGLFVQEDSPGACNGSFSGDTLSLTIEADIPIPTPPTLHPAHFAPCPTWHPVVASLG